MYPIIEKYSGASAPPISDSSSYRLYKISEMENFLKNEMNERTKLMKKTKRTSRITRIIEISLKTSTIIFEGAAIACISTGIGMPVGSYS